jgi:glutamate racemase
MRAAPIGVFDSGVGGLTVLRALQRRLPGESFIYLGDTARLPYGTKSARTVERYALRATALLVGTGVKAIVVACNTASAVALPALRAAHTGLPVFGVVGPGARAAVRASASGRIGVIATESTVRGGAYARAILAAHPAARVHARACPLLVALAEEGWVDGPIAEAVVGEYLRPWLPDGEGTAAPDCVVLGCTHFPLFAPAIERVTHGRLALVDSAATTAAEVAASLAEAGALAALAQPARRLLATDDVDRFARVGGRFLGVPVAAGDVELVDL